MTNLKPFIVLTMFIIPFLIMGCGDNENPAEADFQQEKLISKIAQDADNYSTFSYENDKLSKYESLSDAEVSISVELTYENKDVPQSEEYLTAGSKWIKEYFYNSSSQPDSMAIMANTQASDFEFYGYVKYFYDSQNRLIKTIQNNVNGELVRKVEYSYDSNNNVIEKTASSSSGVVEVTNNTYDDKINPMHSLKDWLIYDAAISENNVLTSTTTEMDTGEITEITHSYTYDSDGYPLTESISANDEEFNFTYEYN